MPKADELRQRINRRVAEIQDAWGRCPETDHSHFHKVSAQKVVESLGEIATAIVEQNDATDRLSATIDRLITGLSRIHARM